MKAIYWSLGLFLSILLCIGWPMFATYSGVNLTYFFIVQIAASVVLLFCLYKAIVTPKDE